MKNIMCNLCLLLVAILLGMPAQSAFAKQGSRQEKDLPLSARIILVKVSPMMQSRKYAQAIETILAFQAKGGPLVSKDQGDPKGYHHPEIYFTLGNCYLLQENFDQAIDAYRRALEQNNQLSTAWLNLAKSYYETNRLADAADCFEKGYETATKKNPETLYYSAASHMMAGNNKRAIKIFNQLFSKHPDAIRPEWKEHLVHALLATDQPRIALPYIRELARSYTGDKQIQWQEILLYQYLQLGMRKEALTLARTLTRQNPTVEKWWKALVHVQLDAGRQEEALMAMTIYSFLSPLSMEEKKLLADLELQEGIPTKARPLYEAALNEKPQKETLQRLVAAYRQLGESEKALSAINKFNPDAQDEELLLLLGELHYSRENFDRAAAFYRKAAQQKGRQVGRAWLMAGYSAWQGEDINASKKAFKKASAYSKQREAANLALQQLETTTPK